MTNNTKTAILGAKYRDAARVATREAQLLDSYVAPEHRTSEHYEARVRLLQAAKACDAAAELMEAPEAVA